MLAVTSRIGFIDLAIIVIYLVGIVAVGCLAGLRQRRRGEGSKGYFLAGGTLTWPMIGLALFSTNISTIHLVGQAQEGYKNGLAHGNFEWMAAFTLIALALFFAPFYFRSKVATLPDFLEKRYGRGARNWLAALSIVSAIFIHIGFTLYTGAVVLEGLFGIDKMVSIVGIALLTGLYTIVGGLLAVVVAGSIQTVVLLAGSICITLIGMYHIGGWGGLEQSVDPVMLTVLRSADDPANLPWYSVFLGYPVIGLWYWCADQTIVQRVLGAKDENHARVGPLFAGFIKILPMFIFFLPGLVCLGLINQGRLVPLSVSTTSRTPAADAEMAAGERQVYEAVAAAADQKRMGVTPGYLAEATGLDRAAVHEAMVSLRKRGLLEPRDENVYAHMIVNLLPTGLRGLMAAALLAALMSTVSGALNSIATLFSYDIFKQWRPDTPDRQLIRVGQIVTFIGMIFAILWSPAISRFSSIYQGTNTLICYIAPPITAVFLWGVFWRKASYQGAMATFLIGSILGGVVFVLDWYNEYTGWNVPFMMTAFYLFVICSVVLVIASTWWPASPSAEVDQLVWKHPLECLEGSAWRGIGNFRFLSGLLFVTMVALYIWFR